MWHVEPGICALNAEQSTEGNSLSSAPQSTRVGAFTFGVIVDRVFDTEEIVVKPVATVLRHLKLYSGATILGDGSVILILDFKSISVETGAAQVPVGDAHAEEIAGDVADPRQAILLFRAFDDSLKAAPLSSVARIEEIALDQLEHVDGRTVIQYRGRLMPVVGAAPGEGRGWTGEGVRPLLVFIRDDRPVGLLVDEIVDIVESSVAVQLGSATAGALGSLIIGESAAELIDVAHYWRLVYDEPAPAAAAEQPALAPGVAKRLLIVDQSPFCQLLLRPLLHQAGYDVTVAADPEAALALHAQGEAFHLIMADTTQRGEPARKLAATLAHATAWRSTPLLGLGLHNLAGPPDGASVLEAVSDTLGEDLRGAA